MSEDCASTLGKYGSSIDAVSLGTCTSDDTSAWCDHPDACSGSFGLHDLAVLAASLEHLVHDDVIARLQAVFEVHDLPLTTRVDEALVDQAIDTYKMVYIQGSNLTGMTPKKLQSRQECLSKKDPSWRETRMWMRDIRRSVSYAERDRSNPFAEAGLDFGAAAHVVQHLSVSLFLRLSEVAARHSGVVPLHSRLFAQWVHHAYPRECPFLHITDFGAVTPDERMSKGDCHASEEEMRHFVAAMSVGAGVPLRPSELTWTEEEELFAEQRGSPRSDLLRSFFRCSVLAAVLSSVAVNLANVLSSSKTNLFPSSEKEPLRIVGSPHFGGLCGKCHWLSPHRTTLPVRAVQVTAAPCFTGQISSRLV